MSLTHPTEARQCKPCGNAWYAQAGYSSLKPGPIMFNAGQNAALAHSRSKYEQHKFCPRCGSDKVKTVRGKGFVPTAAQQVHMAAAAPVAVSVNVNVNTGGSTAPADVPVVEAVSTAASPTPVAPSIPAQRLSPEPDGVFVPSFGLPASDVLSSRLRPPVRRPSLGLGDHVHNADCLDGACGLIAEPVPSQGAMRYVTFAVWLFVAVFVWFVQYAFVVPLACLPAVAHTSKTRLVGYFAILFCGLGVFYSLYYLAAPAVPRDALRPWGLATSA